MMNIVFCRQPVRVRLRTAVDEPVGAGDEKRSGETDAVRGRVQDEQHGGGGRRRRRRVSFRGRPAAQRVRERVGRRAGRHGVDGRRGRDRFGRGAEVSGRIAADQGEGFERGHVPGQGTTGRGRRAGRGSELGPRAVGVDPDVRRGPAFVATAAAAAAAALLGPRLRSP